MNTNNITLTDNDFDNKYTYDDTLISTCFEEGSGQFETYGEDLEVVLKVANTTPKKVWTVVDCDDGIYIIAGYHLVNRINYIITVEDYENENEEYLLDVFTDSE